MADKSSKFTELDNTARMAQTALMVSQGNRRVVDQLASELEPLVLHWLLALPNKASGARDVLEAILGRPPSAVDLATSDMQLLSLITNFANCGAR
ncbi:hypothetical protein M413DRAFT_30925 [Hebeloma cylindrosporum]|uniref:Uncharacterized protein n=1 Tax=Hebeloma cylindrosporum TaxID=76867 RepID=A0A0C3BZJ3_HEBCY|nr:hypothetical protein M413DRAFT_30925 [Hebeloma cylindrosporum h7]